MINEIDIFHERQSCDFTCHAGKKSAGTFCVVSYHHKIIVELGEYGFYAFAESLICPYWRTPVFLVQPIWVLKSNFSCFKEIFLHLSAKIAFVTEHHAVVIFPANILEIMEVMNACRRHVIRMYDTAYAADCMELISIIVQPLRGEISPLRRSISIVTPHCTTLRSCVLTDLYGLGINTEHILGTVNGDSHILANFFGKPRRQLRSGIELPAAYKVGQIVLALMVQTMQKEIFTVESKASAVIPRATTSRSENFGTTPHRGTFPSSFTRFPAKSLQIPRILTKFAMKLRISRQIAFNGFGHH